MLSEKIKEIEILKAEIESIKKRLNIVDQCCAGRGIVDNEIHEHDVFGPDTQGKFYKRCESSFKFCVIGNSIYGETIDDDETLIMNGEYEINMPNGTLKMLLNAALHQREDKLNSLKESVLKQTKELLDIK